MKKSYKLFCEAELYLACAMLLSIFLLVFTSALTRTFGRPINWAHDLSLIIFAWMTFIGGGYLFRCSTMVSIDLFKKNLPKPAQKYLYLAFHLLILGFLFFLIANGFKLVRLTQQRMITTLAVPYTYVTLSVPYGSLLMVTTCVINMVTRMRTPAAAWEEEA